LFISGDSLSDSLDGMRFNIGDYSEGRETLGRSVLSLMLTDPIIYENLAFSSLFVIGAIDEFKKEACSLKVPIGGETKC